jgi:hypothetical protein
VLAPERVVAPDEREAGEVDVDVDGALASSGSDDVDQPGVEALAGGRGGVLGLGLDRLREPEGDPGDAAVLVRLGGRRRRGRRGRTGRALGRVHHEVELTAVEAYVDAPGRHLRGDLRRGLADRLHQRQTGRRVERERQPLRGLLELGTRALGRREQVSTEAVDVGGDVHVHHSDINVMSCQGMVMSFVTSHDVIARRAATRAAGWQR